MSQVPLWVTITLGVLALFGPIGGAWIGGSIAAKRDDARWLREQQREDLRWQREQERLHEQRKHEVALHWREERAATYSAAIAVIDEWINAYKALTDSVQHKPLERHQFALLDERLRVREIESQLWERLASIELIATGPVRQAARNLGQWCRNFDVQTMFWNVADPQELPPKAKQLRKELSPRMNEVKIELAKRMRVELSVDIPTAAVAVGTQPISSSPTPPSAKTS